MMLRLTHLTLAYRSLIALATIAILIVGILIIPSLKQEYLPSVQTPQIDVSVDAPGVSPETVELTITMPLEQRFQGIAGIQQINSFSNEGFATISLLYPFGTDLNQASQKVEQQIAQAQGILPAGSTPHVSLGENLSNLVYDIAISSHEGEAALAVDVKTIVVPSLQRLGGIANIKIIGIRAPIVTVTLDQQKMLAKGIGVTQVQAALQQGSQVVGAGELTAKDQTFAVRLNSAYASLTSLQSLVVGQGKETGVPVKLSDVAVVQQALAPSNTLIRTNGQPGFVLSITKTDSANTVTVAQAIRQSFPSLAHAIGHDTQFRVVEDRVTPITQSVDSLVHEGLIGAGFAIIVIFIFLLSLRTTLVTAISLPLSVVIALIGLWLEQDALNLVTLSGLTIAIGRIVDDSIVVLENIHRHLQRGEPKMTAIPQAVHEVGAAVTASTLTTVAVFLPLGFSQGFIGAMFRPFALIVTIALLASLAVALFVIPILAYWFLKVPQSQESEHEFQGQISMLERVYLPLIKWVTGSQLQRIMTLLFALILLGGTFMLVPSLGTTLIAPSPTNNFDIVQTLAVGTSPQQTSKAALRIEALLANIHAIQSYKTVISGNTASFDIVTDDNADQNQLQRNLQARLNTLRGIGNVRLFNAGVHTQNINVQLYSNDETALKQAVSEVLPVVQRVPDVSNVTSNLVDAAPLIEVRTDAQKALVHGLTFAQIGEALRQVYGGEMVTTITLNGQALDVRLKLMGASDSVASVKNILLPTAGGNVRLGDVAEVVQTRGPTQIIRQDGTLVATISVTPTSQDVGAVSTAVQKAVDSVKLPVGVSTTLGGATAQQNTTFSSLYEALLVSILLVYLIMVATFRNVIYPLILLVSIPFATIGAILLLLFTGQELSISVLIGMLMLVGIVVTNAIVLLDRVAQYRAKGLDARSAVIEGSRERLRPILMTAIATICALVPIALNLGGTNQTSGSPIAGPLAITVIGGLATSTLLTLLLVPTLYILVAGKAPRASSSVLAEKHQNRKLTV